MRNRAVLSAVLAVFLVAAAATGGVTVSILSDNETVPSKLSVEKSSETQVVSNTTNTTNTTSTNTTDTSSTNTSAQSTDTNETTDNIGSETLVTQAAAEASRDTTAQDTTSGRPTQSVPAHPEMNYSGRRV